MKQSKVYIYGKHAVEGALVHAPRLLRKIILSSKMDDKKLRNLIYLSGITTEPLDERQATSQVPGGAMHQGVIALIALGELPLPFADFLKNFSPSADTCLVFLDEVLDPHNVGAIIRSAAAFGATAVLMPKYKQSPVTAGAIKASAGSAFQIPLVQVENVQQALAQLKKMGMRVYALAAEGKQKITAEVFEAPTLFVLGNEAYGVTPALRELCDQTLSIALSPQSESLNVAASSAVALYAWSLQHAGALKSKK